MVDVAGLATDAGRVTGAGNVPNMRSNLPRITNPPPPPNGILARRGRIGVVSAVAACAGMERVLLATAPHVALARWRLEQHARATITLSRGVSR
jgi:predicted fused transcriptional regulator/phosphomethylpyrimidine kinase